MCRHATGHMRLFSRHQARLEDRWSGGSRSWGGGYEPPLLDVDIHGHAVSTYRQTAPPGPPVHTARLPLSFPFQCTARQYTPLFMQCPARAQLGPNGPLRPRELQSVSAPGVSPGFRNLAVASAGSVRCHTHVQQRLHTTQPLRRTRANRTQQ